MKRVREQRERITEILQEAARHLEALSYDDVWHVVDLHQLQILLKTKHIPHFTLQ